MNAFGKAIQEAKELKGWTLEQIAKKVGTYKGYISSQITGHVNPPSAKLVKKLAKALEIDEKKLLVLSYIEKAPKEIREIAREGMLAVLDANEADKKPVAAQA
jgi:transcriptional regulator with XRE-family HTH domain